MNVWYSTKYVERYVLCARCLDLKAPSRKVEPKLLFWRFQSRSVKLSKSLCLRVQIGCVCCHGFTAWWECSWIGSNHKMIYKILRTSLEIGNRIFSKHHWTTFDFQTHCWFFFLGNVLVPRKPVLPTCGIRRNTWNDMIWYVICARCLDLKAPSRNVEPKLLFWRFQSSSAKLSNSWRLHVQMGCVCCYGFAEWW